MIKTVILDMDGTMVDSKEINVISLNKALVAFGKDEITLDDYSYAYSLSSYNTLRYFNIDEEDLEKALSIWIEELRKIRDKSKLFSGIEELINVLKEKGYRLGVITSRLHEEAVDDMERFNYSHIFDAIVTASDVENPKPHSESLDVYMDKTGEKRENILYIGDSIHDSEFSKNANIPFALALWGTSDPNIDAEIKIKHPMDILDYLEG